MDYGSPYLIVAYVFGAAVLLCFVAVMIATGWRYARLMRRLPRWAEVGPSALVPEELGMLAGGARRLVEVVLFRLCLEGRVGLLHDAVVGLEKKARPGAGGARSVREVLLTALAKAQPRASQPIGRRRRYFGRRRTVQRPTHLMDLLYYGAKRGDFEPARRRLVELGLVDESAAHVCRWRDRAFVGYLWLSAAAVIALIGALVLSLAASGQRPGQDPPITSLLVLIVASLLFIVVAPSIARITGGQLFPTTPAGRALLLEAALEPIDARSDSLLRYVAIQGIRAHPDFERAAHRGELDYDLGPGMKTFGVVAEVFAALAPYLGSGGTGGKR